MNNSIVEYLSEKYDILGFADYTTNIKFIEAIAVYTRNHPEFVLERKKKETASDQFAKGLIDKFIGTELNDTVRDRVFKTLNYIFGKFAKFKRKLFRLPSSGFDTYTVFYMYILFLPKFPLDLIRYVNKALAINEDNYEKIIRKCNNDLLRDFENICSLEYGNEEKASDSPFRLNKRLPVSTKNGFMALAQIASKLAENKPELIPTNTGKTISRKTPRVVL